MSNKSKTKKFTGLESVSILSASAIIKGEIHIEDDLRVDGVIEGNIYEKGKILIGHKGCVKGNITSKSVELYGKVFGDANVSEIMTLKAGSYYKGEITAKNLEIETGAVFSGNCKWITPREIKTNPDNKL